MNKNRISKNEPGIVPCWRIASLEVGGLRRTFRILRVKSDIEGSKIIEKTQ